jgi:prepilin-type N-terminal cleavage/methylation domain-containing protein
MSLPEVCPGRYASGRREAARARDGRAGFSLAEMLAVVAIVAILAVASAPWLSRVSRRRMLGNAASEIQTTLLATRMRAVRLNAPASLVVVTAGPTSSSHNLQTIEPDPPPPTPTPIPARSFSISSDAVTFIALPASNKVTFDGNGRRIFPAGGASADIVVEGPTSSAVRNQVTIRTSLTGRVEVVTPTVWQ